MLLPRGCILGRGCNAARRLRINVEKVVILCEMFDDTVIWNVEHKVDDYCFLACCKPLFTFIGKLSTSHYGINH